MTDTTDAKMDEALGILDEVLERVVRVETRMVKLMQHLGLDQYGQPTNKVANTDDK